MQYGLLGLDCTVTLSVSGGASTEATISVLTNNVIYSIAVAAVNSAGIGVYSNPIMVQTDGKSKCIRGSGIVHCFCDAK